MLSSENASELKMSLWSEVGEGKEGYSHKYSPSMAGEGWFYPPHKAALDVL